jgi:hypothetical protein
MDSDDITIVRVHVERNCTGLFMATSPDISGIYVAHRDLNAIYADMPNVIRLWFKRVEGRDVRVFQEGAPELGAESAWNAMAMPVEIADACLRA